MYIVNDVAHAPVKSN